MDSTYAVTWRDLRDPGDPAVYAARVDTLAASQDSTGVRLSTVAGDAAAGGAWNIRYARVGQRRVRQHG